MTVFTSVRYHNVVYYTVFVKNTDHVPVAGSVNNNNNTTTYKAL